MVAPKKIGIDAVIPLVILELERVWEESKKTIPKHFSMEKMFSIFPKASEKFDQRTGTAGRGLLLRHMVVVVVEVILW